jgi:hypothetical protein
MKTKPSRVREVKAIKASCLVGQDGKLLWYNIAPCRLPANMVRFKKTMGLEVIPVKITPIVAPAKKGKI